MKIKNIEKKIILNFFIVISITTYLINYIFKFQLGYLENFWLFFHDDTDRFGDTLKIIFSFNNIFAENELIKLNVPKLWIENNPYNKLFYNSATLTMSLPPLTIIFLTISANLAKLIGVDYRAILIIYSILLIALLIKIFANQLKINKNLIFILFSFPLLFLFDRGNLMAAIAAVCLFYLFRNFISHNALDYYDLLAFVIACSMRPNYLIFGLLFLFRRNNKLNILEFCKVGLTFVLSNAVMFFIAPNNLKGYSFDNFILMVSHYIDSTIKFSSWNSSLYGAIINLYRSNSNLIRSLDSTSIGNLIHRFINNPNLSNYIIIFYMTILIISYWKTRNSKISRPSFLIILCCVTSLATSPFADYHLVIFIFLFFLIYDLDNNFQDYAISLLLISIILLPKFHSFSPDQISAIFASEDIFKLNISNFINSISLNLLIIINIWSKKLKKADIT